MKLICLVLSLLVTTLIAKANVVAPESIVYLSGATGEKFGASISPLGYFSAGTKGGSILAPTQLREKFVVPAGYNLIVTDISVTPANPSPASTLKFFDLRGTPSTGAFDVFASFPFRDSKLAASLNTGIVVPAGKSLFFYCADCSTDNINYVSVTGYLAATIVRPIVERPIDAPATPPGSPGRDR